jgi:hypothetical protein
MSEHLHQHGHEHSQKSSMQERLNDIASSIKRVAMDVLTFSTRPIAFEFRRMHEEAEDCMRAIESSSASGREKYQAKMALSEAIAWLEQAEKEHKLPVIDIRHKMSGWLKDIQMSLAA